MFSILSLIVLTGLIEASCPERLDSDVKILNKKEYTNLCEFSGKTILVVNTASKCGFTPQYSGLQKLYDQFKDRGLVVIAVPSGDFRQELKQNDLVKQFCKINYDLTIPMTSITSVRGPNAHPFYKWIKKKFSIVSCFIIMHHDKIILTYTEGHTAQPVAAM